MKRDFIFTSESVTEGHPDKLCDQISDAIVDHVLRQDPGAQIIAECAISTSIVFIAARFHAQASVDFPHIARQVIDQVGYEKETFDSSTCSIVTSLQELPADMASRFDESLLSDEQIERIPVRDQVTQFGFACKQTAALMPLPIWLAHRLARQLTAVRLEKTLSYLAPDGKVQVGVEYHDCNPARIHSIAIIASRQRSLSSQVDLGTLRAHIRQAVIEAVFDTEDIKPDPRTQIFINPHGALLVGGPGIHAGLTGRKNAIDTYGEYSRHSGAALSGKDPTRIDRVGAYAARYAAKNVVAADLAAECEVQLSYVIGLARPVSVQVETFGTGKVPDECIAALLEKHCDFRLAGIIKEFNLRHLPALVQGGFYRRLAVYGQVGREDLGLPWEAVNRVEALQG